MENHEIVVHFNDFVLAYILCFKTLIYLFIA